MDKDRSIIIGSDHAAYVLKEKIKEFLHSKGYVVEDVGTHMVLACPWLPISFPVFVLPFAQTPFPHA